MPRLRGPFVVAVLWGWTALSLTLLTVHVVALWH